MIFRWLCLKRMKAPFRPYLRPEQLAAVFSDVRLSEWDAFRSLIAGRGKAPPDAALGPEGQRRLRELMETPQDP